MEVTDQYNRLNSMLAATAAAATVTIADSDVAECAATRLSTDYSKVLSLASVALPSYSITPAFLAVDTKI